MPSFLILGSLKKLIGNLTKTATQTKKALKKIILFLLCYFAIISTRSTCSKTANYPQTKLVGVAFKLREKKANPRIWSFHVIVLQRTAT